MASLFKRTPVYIKLFKNKVGLLNLETGESIAREAIEPFSNERFIIADFNSANVTIRSALDELIPKRRFFPRQIKVLIQQVVELEGGLSEIEKRALRDLGEMAGGAPVILVEHSRSLSNREADQLLSGK